MVLRRFLGGVLRLRSVMSPLTARTGPTVGRCAPPQAASTSTPVSPGQSLPAAAW